MSAGVCFCFTLCFDKKLINGSMPIRQPTIAGKIQPTPRSKNGNLATKSPIDPVEIPAVFKPSKTPITKAKSIPKA